MQQRLVSAHVSRRRLFPPLVRQLRRRPTIWPCRVRTSIRSASRRQSMPACRMAAGIRSRVLQRRPREVQRAGQQLRDTVGHLWQSDSALERRGRERQSTRPQRRVRAGRDEHGPDVHRQLRGRLAAARAQSSRSARLSSGHELADTVQAARVVPDLADRGAGERNVPESARGRSSPRTTTRRSPSMDRRWGA